MFKQERCYPITIEWIVSPTKQLIQLSVFGSDTLDNLKGQIQANTGLQPQMMRLRFKGKDIYEGTLRGHDIEAESKVQMARQQNYINLLFFGFQVPGLILYPQTVQIYFPLSDAAARWLR